MLAVCAAAATVGRGMGFGPTRKGAPVLGSDTKLMAKELH